MIAAALRNGAQTVEGVRHSRLGADQRRLLQALRVGPEGPLGIASLSQQRPFPSQHVRKKRIEAVIREQGQRVVVETLSLGGLLVLLRYPCHVDKDASALHII